MGTPIARSAFVLLLGDTLRQVTEDQYADLVKMKDVFFNNVPSEKAWEEYLDVSDLGDIQEFNGKIEYLPTYSGYRKVIEPKEYAAGGQVQQKFIEDNRYDVLVNYAKQLMKRTLRTGVIPYARRDDNSATNWFLVDMDRMKESLFWIDRKPLVHDVTEDWDTYNMLQKIRGRWGYGVIDWRWIFGSNV